jgi:hypothetical protein
LGAGGTGAGGSGTGDLGTGGTTRIGTGGSEGFSTGGSTGTRDAAIPPPDSGGTCMVRVVSNGYACGSTPTCSACKDQDGN